MIDIASQILGILCTICCMISPLMKKKWQMLCFSAAANFLNVLNFFLNQNYSASLICFVGIAQVLLNLRHTLREEAPPMAEKVAFTILYVLCGVVTYATPQDLMPMAGSLLFMCGVFLRKEQNMRKVSLVSNGMWIVYDLIVRSTAIYAQLLSTLFLVIGLIRYREKKPVSA